MPKPSEHDAGYGSGASQISIAAIASARAACPVIARRIGAYRRPPPTHRRRDRPFLADFRSRSRNSVAARSRHRRDVAEAKRVAADLPRFAEAMAPVSKPRSGMDCSPGGHAEAIINKLYAPAKNPHAAGDAESSPMSADRVSMKPDESRFRSQRGHAMDRGSQGLPALEAK